MMRRECSDAASLIKHLSMEQVLEEGTPGARVVIVDCPSPEYLLALLASAALKLPDGEAAAQEGSKPAAPHCIIHLAPVEVGVSYRLPCTSHIAQSSNTLHYVIGISVA